MSWLLRLAVLLHLAVYEVGDEVLVEGFDHVGVESVLLGPAAACGELGFPSRSVLHNIVPQETEASLLSKPSTHVFRSATKSFRYVASARILADRAERPPSACAGQRDPWVAIHRKSW